MTDERAAERERWADIIETEALAWRQGPNTPTARIGISILNEWASRIRWNEPQGNEPVRRRCLCRHGWDRHAPETGCTECGCSLKAAS